VHHSVNIGCAIAEARILSPAPVFDNCQARFPPENRAFLAWKASYPFGGMGPQDEVPRCVVKLINIKVNGAEEHSRTSIYAMFTQ
jgi:hypothetical protein